LVWIAHTKSLPIHRPQSRIILQTPQKIEFQYLNVQTRKLYWQTRKLFADSEASGNPLHHKILSPNQQTIPPKVANYSKTIRKLNHKSTRSSPRRLTPTGPAIAHNPYVPRSIHHTLKNTQTITAVSAN
jgi:hypothetical protein